MQTPISSAWKRTVRGITNPYLCRLSQAKAYDPTKTLLISGSGRSGTTWLAEILMSIDGAALLFEPFHPKKVPEARKVGFDWATFLKPEQEWPAGRNYARKVIRGEVLTPWTTSFMSLGRAARHNRWIVKCIHANLFLAWLAKQFDVRSVLLLRHPCATIGSQIRQGWGLQRRPSCQDFYKQFPHAVEIVESLNTPIEFTAAWWCIQNYAPLFYQRSTNITVVTYEQLVSNQRQALEELSQKMNLHDLTRLKGSFSTPSQMAKRDFVIRKQMNTLSAWTKYWSAREIDTILGVLDAFGMNFYSHDSEPDYARLGEQPLSIDLR